jgi:hypothetical protein
LGSPQAVAMSIVAMTMSVRPNTGCTVSAERSSPKFA